MSDYNGFSNWETWNTRNWYANDPGSEAAAIEAAATGAHMFHEMVQRDFWPDGETPTGLAADILLMALHKIDWDELVDAFTEEE